MTIIVDAGPIITFADRRDPLQPAVARVLREAQEPLVLPAPVTAEIDHLLHRRFGPGANRPFIEDLAAGHFEVGCLDRGEYEAAAALDRRYTDLRLGLADLAVIVLAARFNTTRILTFDERHFRAVQPLGGGAFTLLPRDGP